MRMHHCIADGIALARGTLQITDVAVQPIEIASQPDVAARAGHHRAGLPGPADAALRATNPTPGEQE